MALKTPQDLIDAYENGMPGCIIDLDSTGKLLSSLPMPLFGDFSDEIKDTGKGKLSIPYKSLLKFDPTFGQDERQDTGDCTSHGTRTAGDGSRAVEIDIKNEPEGFIARGATEAIYGYRGHMGEGMSVDRAAKFLNTVGGIVLRKKYGTLDLSKYNSRIGTNWGRSGPSKEIIEIGKQNQVQTISLIRTVAEARDALANGYCLTVGSDVGFESQRDKNGMSRRKGSWGHCMAWLGCDDTHNLVNETIFLIQNSWGLWNNGPKVYEQPDGSFWIREQDAASMLSQNGAWALSNVNGFPPRKINWTLNEVF